MAEATPNAARSWKIIALAFFLFWVGYLIFFAPRLREPLEDSAIDRPAFYNWTAADLDGEPVPFSRFQGKTVFLNIWATWCGPCVSEMPSIARLAATPRLQGKNIEFVCVSLDESPDQVRAFLRGKNWPMTVLHARWLPPVFTTSGIPATFVIAPDGKIVAAELGSADWDTPRAIALLEKTSATPPPAANPAPASNPGPPANPGPTG